MKNNLLLLLCLSFLWQCKPSTNITQSNNIAEIESYLKSAHRDDQYRLFLKKKLVALKNAAWMKSGQGVPMAARPIVTDIPSPSNRSNFDKEFFNKLLAEAKVEHNSRTAKLLNELFANNSPDSPDAIILVRNQSDCDMILKIEGKQNYNLAIPSRGETSLIVNKGTYSISSNLCDAIYNSKKDIKNNLLLALNSDQSSNNL